RRRRGRAGLLRRGRRGVRLGLGGVDQLLVARRLLRRRHLVGRGRLVGERGLVAEARLLGRDLGRGRLGGGLGFDMRLDVEHLRRLVGDRVAFLGAGAGVGRDRRFGRRGLLGDGLLGLLDRRGQVHGRLARRRRKRHFGGVGGARRRRVRGRRELILERRRGARSE